MTCGLRNGRQLGFDGRRMVVPSPPQRLAGPFCNRHPAPAGRRLDLQVFGVFEQDIRRLDAYANSARCLRTSRPKPNADPSRPAHTSLDSRRPYPPATDMPLAQPVHPEPAPVRPHDAAYKLLFSFPEMVRDLLAGFVSSEWVAELDLSTLERWPASQVGDTLRERHQDRVWRVRYRHRWLYVLVLLEFQSTVDRTMAVRVLTYTALLYQDLLRTSTEPLPPVLPIVLHHGPGRWTAAMDVAGLAAPSGAFLAPYQPAQRYFLLDVGDYTDAPLPHGRNLVAALVRLERSRSDADAEAVLGALDAWLSESGNEALRRAVGEWMRQVHAQRRPAVAARPDAENRTEVQLMLSERMQEWMAKARADGQLELMRRMAARKFGGETAERLAERLEPVHDAERLAEIGEWLFECGSGEELLERLERTHASVPDGQEPERQPAR